MNPDEVINLDTDTIQKLFVDYAQSLHGTNAYSTIVLKIEVVVFFFETNGIIFEDYESEVYPPNTWHVTILLKRELTLHDSREYIV